MSKNKFYDYQNLFFDICIIVSYILIFVSALGYNSGTKYLQDLDYYVRIYICLFLIIRFNPIFTFKEFTDLDRKIAFTAGVFILTTTALNAWVIDAKEKALITLQNIKDNIYLQV
jgi:hypothetical protein